MMSRIPTFCLLIPLVIVAGCSSYNQEVAEAPPAADPPTLPAVTDDELSYRHEPLLDDSGTPATVFDAPDPGDSQVAARAFENAPPVIPHNTDGLLPITGDENSCTDCHLPEEAADVGATPVPPSHFYDMRRDKQLDSLNPANYNCTLCHAPQANTGELVENTFEPYFRAQELKQKSNLLETLNEGVE
jgi:cytochrome c-type protein NapB